MTWPDLFISFFSANSLHLGRSPQKGAVTSGGCQKKEHHFADYLMHFEMIYSHFWQNQTTLGLSDFQNKFAPLSFYVCHTNILGFEAFLSSEIWFGLSYSITIAAFCMPNILVHQDSRSGIRPQIKKLYLKTWNGTVFQKGSCVSVTMKFQMGLKPI